ncbi:rifin [Plasmodium reichenowi]|uniref:Rifin n=1 Tax=Plasmodium reichenowi TaxID=5854 RepID=A0A060RQD9_PLARE|nr:rifin [Plasmodium reichenowi]
MKVHYINILLFALPLNILEHNQRNHNSITHYTKTNRSLCECELYALVNYDNDPQMKEIMDNFNKQTQQRLHEYDNRMVEKRKQCKERCDKEIQKIILKDKLEKQMEQQLTTLETKINTDDIPTCVCEKSLAHKTEKFCLNCGMNVGGGVTFSSGILGGIGGLAVNTWKDAAIVTATVAAEEFGAAKGVVAGKAAGMNAINVVLKQRGIATHCPEIYQSIQKIGSFTELNSFAEAIIAKHGEFCNLGSTGGAKCIDFGRQLGTHCADGSARGPPANQLVPGMLKFLSEKAETTATDKAAKVSSATYTKIMTKQTALIEGGFDSSITSIYVSIIAIMVIVLIMVIIYLILRSRRKKKMKKKLQYIKLLEE